MGLAYASLRGDLSHNGNGDRHSDLSEEDVQANCGPVQVLEGFLDGHSPDRSERQVASEESHGAALWLCAVQGDVQGAWPVEEIWRDRGEYSEARRSRLYRRFAVGIVPVTATELRGDVELRSSSFLPWPHLCYGVPVQGRT